MNIWLINHYALTPQHSGGTRHYDLAKELIKKGHRVTIVAASFHYVSNQEMKQYPEGKKMLLETIDGINFIWIKTRPYKGNGIGRVLNMLDFTKKLHNISTMSLTPPEIIVGSSVHLFAVYGAYRLAQKYKVPFVMEVRDIWPQTLIDLGVSKYHPFVLLLGWLEPFLYRKADAIITLLPKADQHIKKFAIEAQKIHWISNGVDLTPFEKGFPSHHLNPSKFNLLYTGTLGLANNLEPLIEAARYLKEIHQIHITLVGSGPKLETLKQQAADLDNITFLPPVPKTEIPALLLEADAFFFFFLDIPLYRFGMSMNKLFDYMAAAKPIVFATNIEENPVEIAQAGIQTLPDDANDIVKAIRTLYNATKETQKTMGDNGLRYVSQHFSIPVIATQFESALIKAQLHYEQN